MRKILILIFTLFFINNVVAIDITTCQTINVSGSYILQNDLDIFTGNCLRLDTIDNVSLDGNGYTISGVDGYSNYGISLYKTRNIEVKNFNLVSLYSGITIDTSTPFPTYSTNNITISNNYISSDNTANDGIFILGGNNININNNILDGNVGGIGIQLDIYNENINIFENHIYNYTCEIAIYDENTGNFIYNNSLIGISGYSICGLSDSTSNINTFYNNVFNNSDATDIPETPYIDIWNTNLHVGVNIVGGGFIGGNFWNNPDNNGYSATCDDFNLDNICDTPYDNEWIIDYYPLKLVPSPTPTPTQTYTTHRLNGDGSDFWYALFLIGCLSIVVYLYNIGGKL